MTSMINKYGVNETSPLPEGYHESVTYKIKGSVCWTTPGLYVTRLRLLSDYGHPFWDVSYCHGTLDGEPVGVVLPFSQLPKKRMRAAIVGWAKECNVYAKRLGVLDNLSTLI